MSVLTTLPIENRTPIRDSSSISFTNSSVKIKVETTDPLHLITTASVAIWVWSGSIDKPLGLPNQVLTKSFISTDDEYISFEVSDILRSYLVTRGKSNVNYPTFNYSGIESLTEESGETVFWQAGVRYTIDSDGVPTEELGYIPNITYNRYEPTKVATLGYRWNYEDSYNNNGDSPGGSLGFLTPINIATGELPRYYDNSIYRYKSSKFKYSESKDGVTSDTVIKRNLVDAPSNLIRCPRDPYLIIFLNKLGLWDSFTPFGKVTVSSKTTSDTSGRSFRDSSTIRSSVTHGKGRSSIDVLQSYTVNTGGLTEEMTQIIEELLYSSKVYLIKFKGDKTLTDNPVGLLTTDNDYISVDNSNISVDNTYKPGYSAAKYSYSDYLQVPVIVKDTDFIRRTSVNDKTNVSYTIVFDETYNKINNIR